MVIAMTMQVMMHVMMRVVMHEMTMMSVTTRGMPPPATSEEAPALLRPPASSAWTPLRPEGRHTGGAGSS